MAVRITDGTDQLAIDASGRAQVNPPTDVDAAGFVALASQVDAGDITGSRYMKELESSEDYRLRVGVDSLLFNLSFEGTTIAQGHIQQNLTTMTAAQASGFLSLNSGNATASGNAANVRTYRTFPLFGTFQTYTEFWMREANEAATNAVSEWGLGYVSGTSAPTDGIFFRRLSGGHCAVLNYAGAETVADIAPGVGYSAANINHYAISVHQDAIAFWVNDVLAANIAVPTNTPLPASSNAQPLFARVYNSGVASAGRRIELGYITVSIGDMDSGKPWSHIMAGMGGGAYQAGPGSTSGQTATFAVGAAPGAATWTASTAPATNSFGGLWTSPATLPAGAETDYPIFAYQNPAGTATLPGRTLYVTGIRIGETILTTGIGANYMVLLWGVGVGSTASSLATTDAAATVGPRRIAVGSQVFAASAAAGAVAAGIQMDFSDAPLVVPAGAFFHVTLRAINNTAAGAARGSVTPIGYFE